MDPFDLDRFRLLGDVEKVETQVDTGLTEVDKAVMEAVRNGEILFRDRPVSIYDIWLVDIEPGWPVLISIHNEERRPYLVLDEGRCRIWQRDGYVTVTRQVGDEPISRGASYEFSSRDELADTTIYRLLRTARERIVASQRVGGQECRVPGCSKRRLSCSAYCSEHF